MNKAIKVFPLLLVFILNFTLFISTPYSKTILNIFPQSDCIWSIIYFVVVFLGFNYFLYCFCMKNRVYSYKKAVILFGVLLGTRLIFDLTYYFFNDTASKSIYALFADLIFDIFFTYVILKVNIGENIFKGIVQKICRKDIRTIIACSLIIISFLISLIILMSKYTTLSSCSIKYTDNSPFYIYNNMNFLFEAQLTRMIFGCISEAAILYMCNLMYFSAKEKNIATARKVAIAIVRITVSVSIIFVVILIKILVNPIGMCDFYYSSSKEYSENIDITGNNIFSKLIFRVNSGNDDCLYYEKTNIDITQVDNIIFSFTLNNFSKRRLTNDNNISQFDIKNSVMIAGTEIIFYSNQYIVFVENTVPQIISFEDICNTNKNDILTEFLEKMITYGYWDFFEYGCDYLLKYDPNFITPYINRYATGEFTENEKNTNADIKTEYMMEFSKQKL